MPGRSSTSGTVKIYHGYLLKETDIKILPLKSNSALLTSLQIKSEAIAPKDVEALAFLAKAVHRKIFQIEEAITFDS